MLFSLACQYFAVGRRLHSEFPYIDAEVRYACREYAGTAVDIIARRLRLAFLNAQAAEEALPHIVEIMAEELKWSDKHKNVREINISCGCLLVFSKFKIHALKT